MDATDRNTALHRVLSGEDDGKPIPLEKMKKIEPGPSPAGDSDKSGGDPPPDGGKGGGSDAKDARIQALEEQLVENAKEFAAQISKLKLDIMQAEMGGGGGDSDEDDADNNDDDENDDGDDSD